MAQLLEAFLIAQVENQNGKPLYGIEVIGKQWTFIIMEGKDYCISGSYDALKKMICSKLLQFYANLSIFCSQDSC